MNKIIRKRLGVALAVVGVVVLVYLGVSEMFSSTTSFSRAYTTYQSVAEAHDKAAFYPSTNQNPVRRDLNRLLSEILVGSISDETRVKYAQQGLALLPEAEAQIDLLGDFVPRVESAIDGMRGSGALFESRKVSNGIDRIIELSEHRLDLIADIRGLSYRANFHTKEIFDRILTDKGKLTPAHAKFLNDQIPIVEEQFNARSNLYTELESTRNAIDATASDILE